MWIDINSHQIVTFPVLSDSFWPVNHGWCLLCHLWVEMWKAQVWLSLFVYMCVCVCVTVCMCICVCPSVYVCVCMWVSMCVCVYEWNLGITCSISRAESFLMDPQEKEDLERRQNLSQEAVFHPKLLPQVSACFLCWAWLVLSHLSCWPKFRSGFLFKSMHTWYISFYLYCAESHASISPVCLLAPWPLSLNSSYFLWDS